MIANTTEIRDNMTHMSALNKIGTRLLTSIEQVRRRDDARQRSLAKAEKYNVVGAGGAITAAYEQLRNAAENTDEHLLLQNAIRRFFKQLFIVRDDVLVRQSGAELIIELTFAGYIPNDSVALAQVEEISQLASAYYEAHEHLQQQRKISADTAMAWVLEALSVLVARVLTPNENDTICIDFAYEYFEQVIPRDAVSKETRDEYGAALYVAIHRALLKSDVATMRAGLLTRYGVSVENLEQFVNYNKKIDNLIKGSVSDELYHIVDRQGAPLRMVRRMVETNDDMSKILQKREVFLEAFEQQITKEYSNIMARINRAIVRSVIFLVITKFLIGIAIEVPYDFWAHGEILWMPLIINLFFPPVYMVLLRFTLSAPGYANTSALVKRIDTMLYGTPTTLVRRQLQGRSYGAMFSIVYGISCLAVFTVVIWLLLLLNFSPVHIAIFFFFFSAASFLGFRLSRMIRDFEIVRGASNGLTFVRDTIYLPFVLAGRWVSDKYSQVNVVSLVLDMLIELPMKTILRLMRQWSAFIDDRKDNIT